ncbi:hypothetical protein [Thauera sp. WH-1]|uniref:YXWGXW repeat-containing protein n=1 Tax=Thauera sp. WH-1 TaxID=3398230 RepID=UPI0039FBC119
MLTPMKSPLPMQAAQPAELPPWPCHGGADARALQAPARAWPAMVRACLLAGLAGATLTLGGCAVVPAERHGYGAPYGYYDDYDRGTLIVTPPPRVEYRGLPPVASYIWIDGYWNWVGTRHVWVPGYWAPPGTRARTIVHRQYIERERRTEDWRDPRHPPRTRDWREDGRRHESGRWTDDRRADERRVDERRVDARRADQGRSDQRRAEERREWERREWQRRDGPPRDTALPEHSRDGTREHAAERERRASASERRDTPAMQVRERARELRRDGELRRGDGRRGLHPERPQSRSNATP